MSSNLQNSIWPNTDGNLGNIKVQIPTNTEDWPKGDALVHNFVFNKGKLVGFVDTKALVNNESKSTIFPYDYVDITLPSILKDTITITPGERCKHLIVKNQEDAAIFITPILEKLLGEGKIKAEFIKNENKLIVHTDRVDDELLQSVTDILSNEIPQNIEIVRYNHHIEVSWKNANKYAECKNLRDILKVEPVLTEAQDTYGVQNGSIITRDLTPSGDFGYPLPNITSVGPYHHVWGGFFKYVSVDTFRISLPKCTSCYAFMRNNSYVKHVEVDAPLCTNYERAFKSTKLQTVKFTGEVVNADYICLNSPNLYSIKGDFSKATRLNGAFSYCILDKESALMIINSIITWDDGKVHNLTLGIHTDHQNDEEVQAAISNAKAKGWELAVQWNGTPTNQTSSTFSLRSMPVYAKLSEIETSAGITELYLDWGHYVTNPQDFQEFPSLQEAYSHFGIQPPSDFSL